MNRRFLSVLMFAFVISAGASVVLYRMVVGRMKVSAPVVTTTSILIAAKDLEQGAVIADSDIRLVPWPGTIPQGAISNPSDVIGRGVASQIYAAEPITESRMGGRGAGGGLAATIPQGMRAAAIHVNEVVGVAGFVVPGTHVDVLVSGATAETAGGNGGTMARTLLQNISVLSAGQDFKKDNEGKPVTVQVVNLLVTPRQAEMLSLASNQMTMQLVLRNPIDTSVTATSGVNISNIFSGLSPAPAIRPRPQAAVMPVTSPRPPAVSAALAPRAPQSPGIEMISGSQRTEIRLQRAEGGQ